MTGCKCGKRRYRSEQDALNHLKWMRKHPHEKVPCRAYYHTDCGGWHLTSRLNQEAGRTVKNKQFKRFLNND